MTTADASLKIEVVSNGIQEASRALGGLSTSAANAEKRVTTLTSSIDKLMGSMTALAKMQGTATSAAEAHINKIQSGTAAMQAMTSSAHATTKTLQQLQSQATKTGNAFGHSHEKANILNNTLKSMMVAASAYISLNFAKSIVESADAWGMMQAKLKIATGSMEQAKLVQQELFDMAQKYRSPLEDMGKLYTRLAPALRKYGMEHKDTQQMVEGVTLALKLNGATTAEAASTMLQFSQAANAGRLNGAEFNSISENGTLILMALEKYLGKTRGELKKMGSDGELTFNLIAAAMKKELPEMQKQFAELPLTVEGAMQRIKNAWAKAVGEEGQRTALGKQIATLMAEFERLVPVIAEKVVGAIRFLIDNGDKLLVVFNGLVALKVAHWAVEVAGGFKKILDVTTAATPVLRLAGAAVAFMGGPLGLIAGALAAGATAWALWGDTAKSQSEKVASTSTILATTSDTTTKSVVLDTDNRIEAIQREIQALNERNRAAGSGEEGGGTSRELMALLQQRATAFKSMQDANTPAAAKENLAIAVKQYDIDIARLASAEQSLYLQKSESKWAANYAKFMEDHGSKEEKFLAKKKKAMEELGRFYNNDIERRIREEVFGDGSKKKVTEEDKLLKIKNKEISNVLENRLKSIKTLEDETEKLNDQIESQKKHNAGINLTATQLAELEAVKLEEQATTLQGIAIKKLDRDLDYTQYELYTKQVEALRELAQLKREGGILQDQKKEDKLAEKEMDKLENEWEKTVDKIDDVFRDGFADMLNHGKSAWKSFTKSLATTFKTMIAEEIYKSLARPFVMNIIGNVAGFLTGGAGQAAMSAAGSAIGGVAGNAASIGAGIAGVGSAFSGGLGAGFAQLSAGVNPLSAISSVMDVGANSIATAAGQLAGYLGPIVAGIGLLVKGLSSKVVGSGILGSAIGDQFSGSSYQFKKGGFLRGGGKTVTDALDPQTAAQFGTAVEAMSTNFAKLGNVTGVGADVLKNFNYEFRLALADFDEEGKKKEIERFMSSMSDSMAMAFVDTFRTAVDAGVQAASKYWTNTIDGQRNFVTGQIVEQSRPSTTLDPYIDDMIRLFDAFKVSLEGVQGSEGKLTEFTTALFTLGANLAKNSGYIKVFGEAITFSKLEAVAQSGETVVQTFNRLLTVFTATSNIAKMLGQDVNTAFGAVGVNSTEARQRLIDLAGGIDVLTNSATSFVQNFYTEQEQISLIAQDVTSVMKELGYETVTTKDQFKALVKGLNLASKADAELYTKLMQIAPAFAQVADFANKATEEALEATKKRVKDAEDLVAEAYKREKDALEDFIKKFTDFGKSLRKFRDDLLVGGLSNLSPEAKYMELKSRFEKTYSMALAGDETAMGQLEGISQQFLEASQGYFASSMGYTQDFDRVREALNQAANAADAQVGIAQRTLSEMQTIVGLLINIKDGILSLKDATYSLNAVKGNGGPGGGTTSNGVYYDQFGNTAFSQNLPTNQDLVKAWYASNPNATNSPTQDAINYWTQQLSRTDIGQYDVKQAFANSVGAVTGTKPVDIKAFANGGEAEGWSWVGEQGKELAYFGDKAHIYTANQSKQMVSGGSEETDALLREVITELKAQTKQGAAVAGATVERLERVADKLDKNTRKIAATTAD